MKLIDHEQAIELFSSYWDGELSTDERKLLDEHLRSCVPCRKEYTALEETLEVMGSLPRQTAPAGFVPGVVQSIRKRSRGRFFTRRGLLNRPPYELFSLLMLGLILALYVILQMGETGSVRLP